MQKLISGHETVHLRGGGLFKRRPIFDINMSREGAYSRCTYSRGLLFEGALNQGITLYQTKSNLQSHLGGGCLRLALKLDAVSKRSNATVSLSLKTAKTRQVYNGPRVV